MGLTIHYTLLLRDELPAVEVRQLVARARSFACRSAVQSVGPLIEVESDFPLAHQWVAVPELPDGASHVDVAPEGGHVFPVDLGEDCETLLLGLCRYPAAVSYRGRELPTKAGAGWRLSFFCKTQFASLHGWEHFLRCHRAAIDLVNFWRTLGVKVQISDEGGYWPRRSEKVLRQRLDEMNGIVAAMGGALKDADESRPVESPIFQHPRFEQLEAEGAAKHRRKIRQAAAIVGKHARKP